MARPTRLSEAFTHAQRKGPTAGVNGAPMVGKVVTLFEDGTMLVSYPNGTKYAAPLTDEFCEVGQAVRVMEDVQGNLVLLGRVK
jgi:hypothetical protein